ncbi:MAG TPA: tRNA pseudouridine(38-40) synthase TruA [Chitinophagaceae bacterium]
MRYFLEVAYKGTNYSGFQSQKNANTIQAEIEKAFEILLKKKIELTGSSRTDAGVHAYQNYFHFDFESELYPRLLYNLNAILPGDIVIKSLLNVEDDAHCRFDAVSREYKYHIYQKKNPFLADRAFYFPYSLDIGSMQEAATIIREYSDFTSFSKRNTQVKTFKCEIQESRWHVDNECLIYQVRANRFLRGMVRALTATMLKLGRRKMEPGAFRKIIEARDCTLANFAVPAHGLVLIEVAFPTNYFK